MVTSSLVKSADIMADLEKQRAAINSKQLWRNIRDLSFLGAGIGGGARGLQGIYNMLRRNFTSRPQPAYAPLTIDMPIPGKEDEEKLAAEKKGQKENNWFETFMSGGNASSAAGHPLMIPLGLTAAGGSLYGGWKLMDWLMDRRRKGELSSELGQAEKDYEAALAGQFKQGSLGSDLDKLFDLTEKEAQAGDYAGLTVGALLALMGSTGLLSGLVVHNLTKKRLNRTLMTSAYRKHRQKIRASRPPVIMARPAPLPPNKPLKTAPNEDEMEGEPLDKMAQIPGSGQIMGNLQAQPKPMSPIPNMNPSLGASNTSMQPFQMSNTPSPQHLFNNQGSFRSPMPSPLQPMTPKAPALSPPPMPAQQPQPQPQPQPQLQPQAQPQPQPGSPINDPTQPAQPAGLSQPSLPVQKQQQQRYDALLAEGSAIFNLPGISPERAQRLAQQFVQMPAAQQDALRASAEQWKQRTARMYRGVGSSFENDQTAESQFRPRRPPGISPPSQSAREMPQQAARETPQAAQQRIAEEAARENAVALNKRTRQFVQRRGGPQPAPVTPEQLLGRPLSPVPATPEDAPVVESNGGVLPVAAGDGKGQASGLMSIPTEDIDKARRLQAARAQKDVQWHEERPVRYADSGGVERFFPTEESRDRYINSVESRRGEQQARKQRVMEASRRRADQRTDRLASRRRVKRFSAMESHPLLKMG